MTRNYHRLWGYTNRDRKSHKKQSTVIYNPVPKPKNQVDTTLKEITNKLQNLETTTKQAQVINVDIHCKCHDDRSDKNMEEYNLLIRLQNEIKHLKSRIAEMERNLYWKNSNPNRTQQPKSHIPYHMQNQTTRY